VACGCIFSLCGVWLYHLSLCGVWLYLLTVVACGCIFSLCGVWLYHLSLCGVWLYHLSLLWRVHRIQCLVPTDRVRTVCTAGGRAARRRTWHGRCL
jgi:hypothetical protein